MRTLLDIFVIWPMPVFWLSVLGTALIRRRTGKFLVVSSVLLFLVGSLPAIGKLLLTPLANGAPAYVVATAISSGSEIAAIIVFSGGAFADSEGHWWPLEHSIRRSITGLQLHQSTDLPIIVTGGSPLPGQPPEAEVIAQFVDLPASQTILETSGRDTFESGRAVAGILADRFSGERRWRVILVTSPSHIARAGAVLRRFDIDPVAAPASAPLSDGTPVGWRAADFIPSARGLSRVRVAWREYVGIAWYLASGRIRLRDL